MDDFIGIIDSGIGGLTVYVKILEKFQNENIVYLADTKNCPYGIKNLKEVRDITLKNINYLKSLGAKNIVIACNTATSSIVDIIEEEKGYLIGVVEPTAQYALKHSKNKKIGIFATNLTVSSMIYETYLDNAIVYSVGCSDFVMPIENGDLHSISMKNKIHIHIQELGEIDTLILGCTHFPYIKEEIKEFLPNVELIESGEPTADCVKAYLSKNNLEEKNGKRELIFLTTGDIEKCLKQIDFYGYQFDIIKKIKI